MFERFSALPAPLLHDLQIALSLSIIASRVLSGCSTTGSSTLVGIRSNLGGLNRGLKIQLLDELYPGLRRQMRRSIQHADREDVTVLVWNLLDVPQFDRIDPPVVRSPGSCSSTREPARKPRRW